MNISGIKRTDDGYRVAFSQDAEGKDIYISSMTSDEKYAAAKAASRAARGLQTTI